MEDLFRIKRRYNSSIKFLHLQILFPAMESTVNGGFFIYESNRNCKKNR